MSDAYSLRQYQSGDEERIVSLLSSVFKGWPHFDLPCSPLDHWKWKYQSSRFELNKIIVVESNGRMVGCSHSLFNNIKVGGKIVKGRQAVDVAVLPDFRDKGVYSSTNKLRNSLDQKANVGVVYSATNNPIIVRWSHKIGRKSFPKILAIFVRIHDIGLFVKDSQIENNLRKQLVRYSIHAAKLFNKIEKVVLRPAEEDPSIIISTLDKFDERVNIIWNAVKENYSFITERTPEHLNWRYRDPRGGIYTVLQAIQNDELLGYIVIRINSWRGRREGKILDVLTLPDRLDCFEALVGEGLRFFDAAGVNEVYYCGVQGHPYSKSLRRFGFLYTRTGINVTCNNKLVDEEDFSQFQAAPPERLLFHYGDIDWS